MANEIPNPPRKKYIQLSFPEDFIAAVKAIKEEHDFRNPHNKISLAATVKSLCWKQIDAIRERKAKEGK